MRVYVVACYDILESEHTIEIIEAKNEIEAINKVALDGENYDLPDQDQSSIQSVIDYWTHCDKSFAIKELLTY